MSTTPNWTNREAARVIAALALFRKEAAKEHRDDEPYQQYVEGVIESAIAVLEQLT